MFLQTEVAGRESLRANWLAEVAEQLDTELIPAESLMITRDDLIAITVLHHRDYPRAIEMFGAWGGKGEWRGLVVRVFRGRRTPGVATRDTLGGDAA